MYDQAPPPKREREKPKSKRLEYIPSRETVAALRDLASCTDMVDFEELEHTKRGCRWR